MLFANQLKLKVVYQFVLRLKKSLILKLYNKIKLLYIRYDDLFAVNVVLDIQSQN